MTTATPPEQPDLKTYWCHECDMSVSLTRSTTPSPLLCPQCNTHFLELMDSPFSQNDVDSVLPSSLFDVVFQDAVLLLTPPPPPAKTNTEINIPIITVTQTLLNLVDPNGVVLCAVCKETISVDEEAKKLPCEHLFHSDCITPWLKVRSSCPLCRFRIEEKEQEENDVDVDDEVVNRSVMMREMTMRLSELSEDDFYGLRITLNHIASRHALIHSNDSGAGENLAPVSELGDGGGDEES